MKTLLRSFVPYLVLLVAAVAIAVAQAPDPRDTSLSSVERLRALIARMKIEQKSFATLVASFEQETSSEMLVETERSKGTFYYEAPDKVRWQYDEPTPKVIVINGQELVTWYQDLRRAERVHVGRYSDAVFKYLGASGSIETLMDYFSLRIDFPKGDEPYRIDLVPRYKRVEKRLKEMSLAIDGRLFIPIELSYVEPNGDSTEYAFTDLRVNEPLPDSYFVLELPSDVDVRVVTSTGR
ncbi:MAG TPA: outer membrane lipoprotein carrier protein LolA [Thermoanaerobaculia bacterium]|nr:outer membrane lipoprotein carrier protein LolA [Thermoanaerobaculia bacterium]